jgi:hypothetical protein
MTAENEFILQYDTLIEDIQIISKIMDTNIFLDPKEININLNNLSIHTILNENKKNISHNKKNKYK